MLHDLWQFLKDVFRQWWARIGVVNGLIGSTGRVIHLDATVEAWMSWGFGIAAGVFLFWAVLSVYRAQRQQIASLQDARFRDNTMLHVVIEKLSGEVLHNVENLNRNAVMLRDEAYQAIGPADLALLPDGARRNLIDFYNKLRSFKDLSLTDDNRSSTIQRKKAIREQLGRLGQKLHSELNQLRQAWAQ